MIFVSDMGDLFSVGITFDYIKRELVDNVLSADGARHMWLLLTKQPKRLRLLIEWLKSEHGISCPDNLVCMTSVTSQRTVWRVRELQKVQCRFRGLSIEPLWSAVALPLDGVNWVIVGGESGAGRDRVAVFDLSWPRSIYEQCQRAGASFFLKQLGSNPIENGQPIDLPDSHGGSWGAWPKDLRVRQVPMAFRKHAVMRLAA
jgi:protein gp37